MEAAVCYIQRNRGEIMVTVVGIDLALTHTGIAVIASTVSGELVTTSARLIETAKPEED